MSDLQYILEALFSTADQFELTIHKTITVVEKALNELLILRKTMEAENESENRTAPTSFDEEILCLQELKEKLYVEQTDNSMLLARFERNLNGERQSFSNGRSNKIQMTAETLSEQANDLKSTAARLYCNNSLLRTKAESLLYSDNSSFLPTSEILESLKEYDESADKLVRVYYEISERLDSMSTAYSCAAPPMRNAFSKDSFESERRSIQRTESAPARPHAPSASNNSAVKTNSENSETKKNLLDFFKRKKRGKATFSEGQVIPPPKVDSVRFSAVAPNKVVLGEYVPINILMYEDAFREEVDDVIHSLKSDAKETKSGYHTVETNSLIRVVLTSADVIIEDNVEEQIWSGKYLNFEFAAKVPNDFSEKQILFTATIYINEIIATKLKLILDCEGKPKHNISISREDIISAFVSYASQDRHRVASIIQGMRKARPDMDIFFDVESLRSGQKWEESLNREIANRDMLFLCWSKHAKESKWVDMEWRYAFESKGEDCIEPIPIDFPDVCPPPAELQQKHFNDKMLFIINATTPTE